MKLYVNKLLFNHLLSLFFIIPIIINGQYNSLEKIETLEDSLTFKFPGLIKKVVLGKSVLGKNITALKISDNVNIDEPEPELLFEACIHGDESYPEQVMSLLAKDLCIQYKANNQEIKNLVDNREIWIIPVLNPDGLLGHDYGQRPNAHGVDLNRNMGYMWNHEDFDTIPYSEPETKILRNFILKRNFSFLTDYHAGLEGIIYPWFYRGKKCPDYNEVYYLANEYLKESKYSQNDFNVTSGFALYQTNGSVTEFAYGSLGISSFAVELYDFHNGSFSTTPKEIYNKNKSTILMFIKKAGQGINGIVKDAITNKPISANIQVDNKIPFYSSKTVGDFHKFLLPGTYKITVNANGYKSKTFYNVAISKNSSAYIDVKLEQKSTNQFISKIIACRNFNNTIDDAQTWQILNEPDNLTYALGDSGWVIVDMQNQFINSNENDLTIYGSGSVNNGYSVWSSLKIDGPWSFLGNGIATQSFNLQSLSEARFIRIIDNGNGNDKVKAAGFNLDAIQILPSSITNLQMNNTPVVKGFKLFQNYPNPFNPSTTIKYQIPNIKNLINSNSQNSFMVSLKVYNVLGKKIETLVNKQQAPGIYNVQFNSGNLSSGIYLYRIRIGNFSQTRQMTLLK